MSTATVATGHDLAVIIPLWLRTKHVERVRDAFAATVPLARVVFVVSFDDDACRDAVDEYDHVVVDWPGGCQGDYARKINAGYRLTTEPFIFTGADDLFPQPHWYGAARALISDGRSSTQVLSHGATLTGPFELLKEHIGVVGTVDDCNHRTIEGVHSTHSLVARWYADQGGAIDESAVIYHEGYEHEYCDDELIQVAMKRESYAHAFDAHVSHVHMLLDPNLDDDTYRHGRSRSRLSRRRFLYRKQLWGG